MKGQIVMNQKELDRIKILDEIKKEKLSVEESSELLGVSKRQVYRLLQKYSEKGDLGLIHGLRGKESNNKYPEKIKKEIIALYRSQYSDYGATLFSEKLLEKHNIKMHHETIRLWLREKSITTSMRKRRPHRKRRERRTGLGEMVQFDGSTHDWFEGRGANCCLLHAIDDATNRVFLRFAVTENSSDAMTMMKEYVEQYGAPRSLYTDRGSVYYASEGSLTDFTRGMLELGTQAIFACSPQAKGRVERGNRTFQDRLVKGLREEGISNIAEANKFLTSEFIEKHNKKFSVFSEAPDVHYDVKGADLKNIFCYKTVRQIKNDYTITLDGVYIQLLKSSVPLPMPKQLVQVNRWLDGSLHIYTNGEEIKYQILTGKPESTVKQMTKPKANHPWKLKNAQIKEA